MYKKFEIDLILTNKVCIHKKRLNIVLFFYGRIWKKKLKLVIKASVLGSNIR